MACQAPNQLPATQPAWLNNRFQKNHPMVVETIETSGQIALKIKYSAHFQKIDYAKAIAFARVRPPDGAAPNEGRSVR